MPFVERASRVVVFSPWKYIHSSFTSSFHSACGDETCETL